MGTITTRARGRRRIERMHACDSSNSPAHWTQAARRRRQERARAMRRGCAAGLCARRRRHCCRPPARLPALTPTRTNARRSILAHPNGSAAARRCPPRSARARASARLSPRFCTRPCVCLSVRSSRLIYHHHHLCSETTRRDHCDAAAAGPRTHRGVEFAAAVAGRHWRTSSERRDGQGSGVAHTHSIRSLGWGWKGAVALAVSSILNGQLHSNVCEQPTCSCPLILSLSAMPRSHSA